ncbi:MAG: hypothetical protein V1735_02340 [Nanoarchaeota archaeon]
MLQTKDWISLLIGAALTLLGLLPLLKKIGMGPPFFELKFLPVEIFSFIVAIAGAYLVINSITEIVQSNPIGKISFVVALVFFIIGMLQVLFSFSIGPDWFALKFISHTIYYIIFMVEGIFLMIAMFAMEL